MAGGNQNEPAPWEQRRPPQPTSPQQPDPQQVGYPSPYQQPGGYPQSNQPYAGPGYGQNPMYGQQPPQGYPPQGYPPQPQGYPPQGYPPAGYPTEGGYAQPFGVAQQGYFPQPGYVPPPGLPTECFGGFWMRAGAILIDMMVVGIPLALVEFALMAAAGVSTQEMFAASPNYRHTPAYEAMDKLSSGINIVVNWLYFGLLHSKKGATLGKMALGLRVVDEYGMYPGFGRATGRYFATILSSCGICLGWLWAGFHPQKRSWHDLIAGTYVVRKEFVNPGQPQV